MNENYPIKSIPYYKKEVSNKMVYEKLRKHFKDTPEYVLREIFDNVITDEILSKIKLTYYGDPIPALGNYYINLLNGPWRLTVLKVNPVNFDNTTIDSFIQRDFGYDNTYQVPNDLERTEYQDKISTSDGKNEPIIVTLQPGGKFRLIEGWHRTMSILRLGDNGDDLKNWGIVKIRAFVKLP